MNSLFTKLIKFFTQTFHSPKGGAGGGFVHAFALIRADKLFSTIYIAGTAVAIASAMVVAIVLNIMLADIAPEVNRSRTLYLYNTFKKASQKEEPIESSSTLAIDSCFKKLKCVEAVAALADAYTVVGIRAFDTSGQQSVPVTLFDVNPDFFRLYEFSFMSGRSFSEKEFRDGDNVCVISDKVAKALLNEENSGEDASSILVNGFHYRVVGIVKRVSFAMDGAAADVYIPYTSEDMSNHPESRDPRALDFSYAGSLSVRILLKKGYTKQDFLDEFEPLRKQYEAVTSAQIGEQVQWITMVNSHFAKKITWTPNDMRDNSIAMKAVNLLPPALLMLLFLFLPAINLSGLVSNRMEARRAEMGIRKAFGAKRWTLLREVLFENLVLTLMGGLVGWLLSWVFISLMRGNIIFKLIFGAFDKDGYDFSLDYQMFITPTLFLVCFLCCAILNLMAALIPSWHSLRKPIVDSLNQKR